MFELYRELEIEFKNLFVAVAARKPFDVDSAEAADTKEMSCGQFGQEILQGVVTQCQFCFIAHTHINFYQVITTFYHDDIVRAYIHIFKMLYEKAKKIFSILRRR